MLYFSTFAKTHPMRATGTFTVEMQPVSQTGDHGITLGQMTLAKTFRGDLDGSSKGTMLTAVTPIKGSADYVAIEQFTGSLSGKTGSFVLTHHGRMHGETSELSLSVVPDSGTGELEGLRGTMTIDRNADGHRWTLTYEL